MTEIHVHTGQPSSMKLMLEDKTALITGAASGIGAATARIFAREGARLMLADCDLEAGEALAAELRDDGFQAYFKAVDVSRESDVEALLGTCDHQFGGLDCAFNNAGINSPANPIEAFSLEDWSRVIAVNLTGVFLCMKYELAMMKERRVGVIVNTSSGGGLVPMPNLSAYCASKHGVLGLTKTAAREALSHGIRVNAILPGCTDTPLIRKGMEQSDDVKNMVLGSIPAGRMAFAEEIGEAVAWLCSDKASYVSGVSLSIDMASVAR